MTTDTMIRELCTITTRNDAAALSAALSELLGAIWELDLTCSIDHLNPCWAGRQADVPGKHWGGGIACASCTTAARAKAVEHMLHMLHIDA